MKLSRWLTTGALLGMLSLGGCMLMHPLMQGGDDEGGMGMEMPMMMGMGSMEDDAPESEDAGKDETSDHKHQHEDY